MSNPSQMLHCCLYFTANALSRTVTRLADEAFFKVGLSPSHAFLLMLVIEHPGINQKELSAALHLAPSTVSRFADLLVGRGLVVKESHGKTAAVSPTDTGKALLPLIQAAWKSIHAGYSTILGEEDGARLTADIDAANAALEGYEAEPAQHACPLSPSSPAV